MTTDLSLTAITEEFASAFMAADSRRPTFTSRTGRLYQPGLGPHGEDAAVALVLAELRRAGVLREVALGQALPYPGGGRRRCDLWLGEPVSWAIEVKMARFRGDNGKPDDTAIKDILSPYDSDRSALTDTTKLADASFGCRTAILIYGFDYPDRLLEPVIAAFELLARARVELGERQQAVITDLVHPVHREGGIYAWEVRGL